MSFEQYEDSVEKGEPLNLFLFEYGPSAANRIGLCDAEVPILHDGVTYRPIPLQRGNIVASGTLDKTTLEMRTDRDNEVAEMFRIYPPSQTVRVTIFQGHKDDPAREYMVIWTGRVLNVKWEGSEVSFSCEPVATSLRRPGLRRRYQIACPHVLYGPICRANKLVASTTVNTVAAVNGLRQVDVHYELAGDDLRTLRAGTLEWTTTDGRIEARTILTVQGVGLVTTLKLTGIVNDLPGGYPVSLVRACNHDMSDCGNLYANLPNYGGMPWIPTTNPMGKYSPYY
jgi:hypothetical protein